MIISSTVQAMLDAGRLVARDFVWIEARRRDNPDVTETRGLWNDAGTYDFPVIDRNNVVQTRTYVGGGHLVGVGAVPMVTGLSAQSCDINLSIASAAVDELVREWTVRRAIVEIHRGFMYPDSKLMPEPAIRRFVGMIDDPLIPTSKKGRASPIRLTAANLTQELLRSNSDMRSDASQRKRNPNDSFYRHTASIKSWVVKWGDRDS